MKIRALPEIIDRLIASYNRKKKHEQHKEKELRKATIEKVVIYGDKEFFNKVMAYDIPDDKIDKFPQEIEFEPSDENKIEIVMKHGSITFDDIDKAFSFILKT